MTNYDNNKEYLFNLVFKKSKFQYLREKTIFLTGVTGFLGKWLFDALIFISEKNKLNLKINLLIRKKNTNLEFVDKIRLQYTTLKIIFGDIRNFEFPSYDVDHIIHLASESLMSSLKDSELTYDIIFKGTKRITEFSKVTKAESITYLSSGAVYGKNCLKNFGWKENDPTVPLKKLSTNSYAISKKKAEDVLIENFRLLKTLKTLNIFRSFSFGGAGFLEENNFAFDNFIKNRLNNKKIKIISNGKSKRNYMHPADLANWLLKTIKFKKINIINTGSEKNYTIEELAKKISKFKYESLELVDIELGNNKEIQNYIPNLSKAKKLGLKSFIPLNLQIEDSLKYYYYNNYEKKNSCI